MAIINGYNTQGKTAAQLMSHIANDTYGAYWKGSELFDKISADDLLNSYYSGDYQKIIKDSYSASKNGYTGTRNDYIEEELSKLYGVPYESKNKTIDDLNAATGAGTGNSSSGTSYLDQLTAIQNSGNAPSANMEGWADSFINKLGKAQNGGDSKEDAFNKMWANYAEGNPDHASPELQAVLRQMAGLDGGNSGSGGVAAGSDYVSMPSNPVSTPSGTFPNNGGSFSPVTTPVTAPGTFPGTGGFSSSATLPNAPGLNTGNGTSGAPVDAFAQYLANVTDSAYNKQMSGSIADLENLYKDLFGNIQSGDYTKKPYYQTILESYGLAGDAAADNAVAGSVGSNGGNLDSYAAANAKRQQLAYKNAAQGAALDAYNAEIGNLIKTLGDMGVNVNDLYATWAQNLASERGTAADVLLGQLGIDRDKYVTDAQAAVDKYLGELGLEGTKVQADADKYLGQLGAETDRYLGELSTNLGMSQIEADKYLGDLNANLGMSQIEADKQMNADTLAAQREIAQMESRLQKLIAEIQSATDIRKQELIKEAAVTAAKLEAQAAKYGYDVSSLTEQNVQLLKNESAKLGYDMEYLMAAEGYTGGGKIEEATDAQKRKALEIHRTLGDAAFEEFVASFPDAVQQSLRAYDAQFYVDESVNSNEPTKSAVEPDALHFISNSLKSEMRNGASFDSASAKAWNLFISRYPEYNTEAYKDMIYAYLATNYNT